MKFIYYLLVLFFGVFAAGLGLAVVEALLVGKGVSPGAALMALVFALLTIKMLGKAREA